MIKIKNIGYNHTHDGEFSITKENGLDHWLFLVVRTEAVFEIGAERVEVRPNSIIFFTPNQPYSYHAVGELYADDWCHFSPDESDIEFMSRYGIPRNKIITMQSTEGISTIIRYICCEFFSDNPCRELSADLYFKLIILKIHNYLASGSFTSQTPDIPSFTKLLRIRENIYGTPSQQWDVERLSASVGFSSSHFQHLYAKVFGIPFRQDIIKARIRLAQNLLRSTEKSIAEVAVICGYENVNHFTKMFKTKTGATPSAYRTPYIDPPDFMGI